VAAQVHPDKELLVVVALQAQLTPEAVEVVAA
jgi:hypothetical protein